MQKDKRHQQHKVHHKSLNLKTSMKKKGLEKKAEKEFAKIKHTQKDPTA